MDQPLEVADDACHQQIESNLGKQSAPGKNNDMLPGATCGLTRATGPAVFIADDQPQKQERPARRGVNE
jgi:hypothetical protein